MPVPQLFRWSPRPDQSPDASPASQSSSRFGLLHSNVRSMINGSSVYSQDSPAPSANNTPKIPFLGFLRRPPSPPAPIVVPDAPRDSSDSRSPLQPRHTAASYMRTIAPLQDPREPETIYNRDPPERHPADVPLDYNNNNNGQSVDPETEQLQDEIHNSQRRRKRRRHRRKHHRQQAQWVRRGEQRGRCVPSARGAATRSKLLACIISGLFLATVLAICTYLPIPAPCSPC